MNLDVLKKFDPGTVSGILAAAALSTSPDPGIGERPLVVRTYEREATAALAEIRNKLNISDDIDSVEARASVSKTLADALRRAILERVDTTKVLSRIGAAGQLPPAAYNVIQPPEFAAMFYATGLSRNYVEEAVKYPDDHQHLMTEAMPESWRDISLFMKRVMSRDFRRRHWLLVQSHRIGIDQKVIAAWQVFPDDVDLQSAQHPIDVLKAFVTVYGCPISIGGPKALFIESQLHPRGNNITIDHTGAPEDHFLSTAHTTDATGQSRVGVTYCIDMPKYRAALQSHGVKVEQGRPTGRSMVLTRTSHASESV
jgi:hypothetical protein